VGMSWGERFTMDWRKVDHLRDKGGDIKIHFHRDERATYTKYRTTVRTKPIIISA